MAEITTLRFAGFGGQGIVKTGEIFGAAAVADGKRALQNQSYGSSARGGVCTADVVVGTSEIYELEPDRFDVLVVLSQDSCNAFLGHLADGGTLIYEQDLVKLPAEHPAGAHGIAATQIASERAWPPDRDQHGGHGLLRRAHGAGGPGGPGADDPDQRTQGN